MRAVPRTLAALAATAVLLTTGVPALTGGNAFAQETVPTRPDNSSPVAGAAPVSACDVTAVDVPDDAGGAIRLTWGLTNEEAARGHVAGFEILRAAYDEEEFTLVGEALPGDRSYIDQTVEDAVRYRYVVRTVSDAGPIDSEACPAAASAAQWFARGRLSILIATVLFSVTILYFIGRARRGDELYIRKIPGLDAVDDAVGRATEMGRPVLYVPGIETVSEVGTLAALTILGHVARRVARHGTPLEVPCADPIVMTTAQEIVRAAYAEAGQPDRYDPSKIAYLTYDQFGYTAGVDGMMVRDRPEAVFLLGYFAAESLILAETGHSIGAIQIAGTKETSQLPFFVAACDYTLIGEELFAASSYLSREPVMLGSLKGQDLAKLVIVIVILFAFVVGTAGALIEPEAGGALSRVAEAFRSWFN